VLKTNLAILRRSLVFVKNNQHSPQYAFLHKCDEITCHLIQQNCNICEGDKEDDTIVIHKIKEVRLSTSDRVGSPEQYIGALM